MTIPPHPPAQIIESPGRRALWDYFPSRTNNCPGWMKVYDKAYGKSEVKRWICGSVQHIYDPCGPRYVKEEIANLNERFHRFELVDGELVAPESIYFVEGPYDPAALNRLNQRRWKHLGGYAVIRRHRGRVEGQPRMVHVYADRPYPGKNWPKTDEWEELTPTEAISRVAEKSLLLPGVFSARALQPVTYSGTWEVEKSDTKSDGPQRFVTLGVARNQKVFRAAERVMTVLANLHLGVHPASPGEIVDLNMIPLRHQDWWVETNWQVVGRLNAGQPEHEVVSWWLRTNAIGS
jgi:hypothetical protein